MTVKRYKLKYWNNTKLPKFKPFLPIRKEGYIINIYWRQKHKRIYKKKTPPRIRMLWGRFISYLHKRTQTDSILMFIYEIEKQRRKRLWFHLRNIYNTSLCNNFKLEWFWKKSWNWVYKPYEKSKLNKIGLIIKK